MAKQKWVNLTKSYLLKAEIRSKYTDSKSGQPLNWLRHLVQPGCHKGSQCQHKQRFCKALTRTVLCSYKIANWINNLGCGNKKKKMAQITCHLSRKSLRWQRIWRAWESMKLTARTQALVAPRYCFALGGSWVRTVPRLVRLTRIWRPGNWHHHCVGLIH